MTRHIELTPNALPFGYFHSESGAADAMYQDLHDSGEFCVDNYRFAFLDDAVMCAEYEEIECSGCCGSMNLFVIVDGREALIGCNYGH